MRRYPQSLPSHLTSIGPHTTSYSSHLLHNDSTINDIFCFVIIRLTWRTSGWNLCTTYKWAVTINEYTKLRKQCLAKCKNKKTKLWTTARKIDQQQQQIFYRFRNCANCSWLHKIVIIVQQTSKNHTRSQCLWRWFCCFLLFGRSTKNRQLKFEAAIWEIELSDTSTANSIMDLARKKYSDSFDCNGSHPLRLINFQLF